MSTEAILAERGKTHGSFPGQAIHSQGIKSMLAKPDLDPVLAEGLDMIAVKLSRIICGDPHEPDHWADIAGYARLVADYLEGSMAKNPPAKINFRHSSPDPEPVSYAVERPAPPVMRDAVFKGHPRANDGD